MFSVSVFGAYVGYIYEYKYMGLTSKYKLYYKASSMKIFGSLMVATIVCLPLWYTAIALKNDYNMPESVFVCAKYVIPATLINIVNYTLVRWICCKFSLYNLD